MNTPKISPDDPRLTAYALGELDESERPAFEARLREDPAARATVEQIKQTVAQLEHALAAEPLPEIEPVADPYREPKGKLLRFPRLYYIVGTLAAACFAVMVVMHQPAAKPGANEASYYTEMALAADDTDVNAADSELAEKAPMEMPASIESRLARDQAVAEAKIELARNHVAEATRRTQEFKKMAGAAAPMVSRQQLAYAPLPPPEMKTENYAYVREATFQRVADQPLSTFSIDVDTASYANVRRMLNNGQRPPVDAVRIEELLNYFPYNYTAPVDDNPFAATMEIASAPWAPAHRLVRIGLKGREVSTANRPGANLVFLLDVSGSMSAPNKLPLVKQAMRLLVERLRPDDRVAIVTYAGASGLALPSTPARQASEIMTAVDTLQPAGSTNGTMGIQLAYDIAKANFVTGGINRVILCTDGDFNVGPSDEGSLTRLIAEKAKSGVFLSVLGFGMGNYQDATLETLADDGNGNYGYIDSKREAEKLLVEQINGTLVTIAKDVKIQVEFNPTQVASYRLIGYENRTLQKADFANDAVDAGEIGAGHTVTALYEIVPVGSESPGPSASNNLKYQHVSTTLSHSRELLTLKIRYKAPEGEVSRLLEYPLVDQGNAFAAASGDFKFASAVAGFGMLLRDSEFKGDATWGDVSGWARAGMDQDAGGYRNEFLSLIGKAEELMK
jgi:Ca-activated chloride channel homolog